MSSLARPRARFGPHPLRAVPHFLLSLVHRLLSSIRRLCGAPHLVQMRPKYGAPARGHFSASYPRAGASPFVCAHARQRARRCAYARERALVRLRVREHALVRSCARACAAANFLRSLAPGRASTLPSRAPRRASTLFDADPRGPFSPRSRVRSSHLSPPRGVRVSRVMACVGLPRRARCWADECPCVARDPLA